VKANVNGALEPPAFVAVSVALAEPKVVGVPLITPVVALSESPAGKPVAAYEVGALVATIW
jgi:hypothetical protein